MPDRPGDESPVFAYRRYRNSDPPAVVTIWNESFPNRGCFPVRHGSVLDSYILSKPYFDPDGLILAFDGDEPAGFILAGFGPDADRQRLDRSVGVVCLIGVRPEYRRRGVGTELLRRAEEYLRDRGAVTAYAGPMTPACPFGFGIYGGADSSGFLDSDADARPFLESQGYQAERPTLVYQRPLDRPLAIVDHRFTTLRRQYEFESLVEAPVGSWWDECVLGPIDPAELRLIDKTTRVAVASARLWEMEGFSWRWGTPAIGLLDLTTRPEHRRRGIGKLLGVQILKFLQEQFFGLVEAHAGERDQATTGLLRNLGFEQVDTGRVYRKRLPTGT